jgi:hypothetical protein
MTWIGPRRALAAFFCASLLLPSPALAAVVAELSVRPALVTMALPPASIAALPSAALNGPGLAASAAPALLAAPAAAPSAEPVLPAGAAPAAVPPAAAPVLVPETPSRKEPLSRARASLRSATMTARAFAILAYGALVPSTTLPVESYLRENQEYAVAARRGALADGSVVESADAGRAPYRVTLSHAGLKDLFSRVDAIKSKGLDESALLAALRSAVAGALPRGRTLSLRAVERRRALARRAVELGIYPEQGRGTENEGALLANLALQRAGFKPKLVRVRAWRRENGRVMEGERTANLVHSAGGQVVFDPAFAPFDGRKLQDLIAPRGAPGVQAGVIEELDGPRVFSPAGKPKTSGVEAKASGDKELTFAVTGRSAADRQFKEDQKKYDAAAAADPVTVEWLFFPFYVDGHTALRVGDQLFEFTRKGWRAHNARAFLFNNPYFDSQLARHPNVGMPPFSLGVPLALPKEVAARLVETAAAGGGRFSFWFNNCNQVPFRLLRRAGIALGDGRFAGFSSMRAFRELLLHPPAEAGAPRLYALPNQAGAAEPLGPAVPRYLTRDRSVAADAAAYARILPRFFTWGLSPAGPRATAPAPKG